ncbi:MAG: sulfite exporter TauE/SafE family protein, partial [Candidatus Kapaibacterium sp.]
QLFNIVAIPSGVVRYIREGRMVWPLVWIVVLGTLPGVFIGAFIRIEYLPDPQDFKFFAGFVLLYIGMRLIRDILKKKQPGARRTEHSKISNDLGELPRTKVLKFNLRRMSYEFRGEKYSASTIAIATVSFIVGIVGGIYGIGGGAIMAPFFVAIFGLPVYTIAGAALSGTFITSVAGVIFYQLLAPYYPEMSVAPDWMLGFLFGIGGFAGMYLGARLQKHMPEKAIKWILAASISFVALKYIFDFF